MASSQRAAGATGDGLSAAVRGVHVSRRCGVAVDTPQRAVH